jgi:hypothetical protein
MPPPGAGERLPRKTPQRCSCECNHGAGET